METTQTYHEHTITIAEDWRFKIDGPALDDSDHIRWFDSAQAAKEYIDKRLQQHDAQNRERLAIPVLDENGSKGTITGAHAGHYGMLGLGTATVVYPALPRVAALLAESEQLTSRLSAIRKLLAPCRIETRGQYGIRSHPEALASIKNRVAKATEAAAKLAAPKQD